MKIGTGKRDGESFSGSGMQTRGVTKENYLYKSKTYMGGDDGYGFVIRAVEGEKGEIYSEIAATDAQWIAWIAYLSSKGIQTTFTQKFGLATVPAEWPEMFDFEAPYSDRSARLPRRFIDKVEGPRTLPDWLRPLSLVEAGFGPKRKKIEINAEIAALELAALREKNAQPVTLSNAARAALGFPLLTADVLMQEKAT